MNTPAPLTKDTLRVIPLGGVGEIGRNCTTFEINDQILIVDCGVLFPEESQPGVDLILPDLGYLSDKLDRIAGLVLTHGHEDHIGGVPYLLKMRPDIPVYGSKLTIAFVQEKLAEHRVSAPINIVSEGMRVAVGEFECEFVAVNHSIPDSLAVIIRSKAGTVLATGDFKMDQLPLDGRLTDLRAFAKNLLAANLFIGNVVSYQQTDYFDAASEIKPLLHLWSLAGGWPAAWWAQRLLRHKSSKAAFLRIYWLTVLLHTGATVAWWAGR